MESDEDFIVRMPAPAGMACPRMSFTWRGNEILSPGWPGASPAAYAVALAAVFAAAAVVEWCHHHRRDGGAVASAASHAGRVCVGYALMLAVMSLDVGVLAAAVSGHAMGFVAFGCQSSSLGMKQLDRGPPCC